MIWVGLDVHKGFSRMGMFDPASGAVQDLGTVRNEPCALEEKLSELPSPKTVVLEAGRSSYHMAGLLEAMAEQVWIVDPGEVWKLQRRVAKTDRRDAAALAWWAAKGVLTPRWRPDAELLGHTQTVPRAAHSPRAIPIPTAARYTLAAPTTQAR